MVAPRIPLPGPYASSSLELYRPPRTNDEG